MNLYVVRHGYTDENEKKTYYGKIDPNLNLRGIKQCENIKKYLEGIEFSKIYVSSKNRAKETATLIVGNCNTFIDERLDERNFGIFEGKDYTELMAKYSEQYEIWSKDWINYRIPKGESHKDFSLRVYEFFNEILLHNNENDNVLLVTHGGVMRAIYTYVMDKNMELFWKFSCNNGDLAIIKYEYKNIFIDSIVHFKE